MDTVTELERLHIGTCVVTEVQSAPWAAIAATTWRVDCTTDGCPLAPAGLDRGTAEAIAMAHRCRRAGSCAVCDTHTDGPWCSPAHHRLEEPGAYENDDIDEDVVYPEIGDDL